MAERKYSVSEIHMLRNATAKLMRMRCWSFDSPAPLEVEAHLNTYMLNGTTVEEIEAEIEVVRQIRIEFFAKYSTKTPQEKAREHH